MTLQFTPLPFAKARRVVVIKAPARLRKNAEAFLNAANFAHKLAFPSSAQMKKSSYKHVIFSILADK